MAFASKTKKPKNTLDAPALYEYAVRQLASKMRTVAVLKRLMRRHVEPGEAGEAMIDAVVLKLKQQNYLNDTRFAQDYTRMRQENEKFGRRRVQQDLAQKGVHSELIATTLSTAYDDLDEAALCRAYIARKRMKPPVDQKETARALGRLARAGFSTGTIFKVLKSWNVTEEALDGLEGIEDDDAATRGE
ncbi:MAG TPA: regulatory protein RecX [Acidobacteriaceae bacterium]|nr:regulatory protein RecX [Acidobacteriaceae bacterium]